MAMNLNRVTQQQVSEATRTLPAPRFLISCSLLPHFSVCVPLPAGIGTPPPTAPCGATKHREIYLHVSLVVPCTVATAHTGRWTGPHTLVLATPCAWSEGF